MAAWANLDPRFAAASPVVDLSYQGCFRPQFNTGLADVRQCSYRRWRKTEDRHGGSEFSVSMPRMAAWANLDPWFSAAGPAVDLSCQG